MSDLTGGTLPTGTSSGTPAGKATLNGLRLLLVEDSLENQRFLTFLLRKRGAEITIAGNGRLGVEALTHDGTILGSLKQPTPFDAVLMDMQMPEMDGYTATALLRQKGCRLPIIAVTAHAMATDRAACLAAGCDEYVTKPVVVAELERVIQQLTGLLPAAATN